MKKSILLLLSFYFFTYGLEAQKKFDINEYYAEENFKRGVYYYNETKFLTASEFFVKALQYDPDYSLAKSWLGRAYYKAGYIENAVNDWQEAVDNGVADNILINKLNTVYYRLGRSKKNTGINTYVNLKTIDGNRWDSQRFLEPASLFVNFNDEIYITGLASGTILHFDPNFKLIKNIKGKKSIKMPFGFAKDSKGDFYVSDAKNDNIQKFNKNGDCILLFGKKGIKDGEFLSPEALCIDYKDNLYAVDAVNCRVQKFSPDGKFLMKFGKRGENPGEFYKPVGITIDKERNIYVSDHARNNIQKFDSDGNFMEFVFEDKKFSDIWNIHSMDDYFMVADGINGGYIYDKESGVWQNLKHFNFSRDKFYSVSDMAFNKDKNLYVLDFYKNKLEIFVPETYKYGNLESRIDMVDISKYPQIALYCSIYKKDGSPVIGLDNQNFKVKELGIQMIPYNIVKYIYDKNKVSMLFLVEKSFEMKKYTDDLKEAASFCLKDIFNNKDTVKVLNFHNRDWIGLDYSYQRLKILESLSEDNYHYVTDLSAPLYNSVTELMNKLSRKAVIFFTAGGFNADKNFKNHDFEICKNYAKLNHIPFYIINFTRNNEDKLKELARSTDGEYYYYFKDTGKLKNIRDDILKVPQNNYIITYETLRNSKLANTWREVELQVNYNKLSGIDKTGYYVPEHK